MRSVEGFVWHSERRVLTAGGRARVYRLYRPRGLSRGNRVPLVMVLHGGFGSGAQAEYAYRWNDLADVHGFVLCYPDGLGHSWNAGTCCGPAVREGVDDVAFLAAVLEEAGATEGVDPRRVYAAGISNGAMMAYRLGCDLPGRLAAIGSVAGTMVCECRRPAPISVLAIHGLEDANLPFGGGIGAKAFEPTPRPPVLSVMDVWRQAGRCGPPRVIEAPPVRTESWSGPNGIEVRLTTIAGAGHQWPGGRPPAPRVARALRLDPPSPALDATAVLWDFFAAHPRLEAPAGR
ncbi:MAG TPA: PHB depolymerase family esterase [Actinomycetota bacterium]|nr:PHB depolymerase family esterase [Actinomycetota bacterium]